MLESNQQKEDIVAAGLLDKIANMFFKGIDKILDGAVEYEEEMGVLKQVTRVPVTSNDGKEYTITIKLSPIKTKKGTFYVEINTDAPGFDASELDKKAIGIDNINLKDFNKKLDKLLEKNNLSRIEPQDRNANDDSLNEELRTLINAVMDYYDDKNMLVNGESNNKSFNALLRFGSSDIIGMTSCKVTIAGLDLESQEDVLVPEQSYDVELVDDDGTVLTEDELIDEMKGVIEQYCADSDVTLLTSANSSTVIEASFIREKGSNEVSLTAIHASCNIKAASELIYTIADSDDFINSLPENVEQSFRLTDEGEDIDVERIPSVDISDTYKNLFRSIAHVWKQLYSLRWAVGERAWSGSSTCTCLWWPIENLLDVSAKWIVVHTKCFPTLALEGEFKLNPIADYETEGEDVIDVVEREIANIVSDLLDALELYYVNLEHDEQAKLDQLISEIKNVLAYT